jgi:NADP-dependent 3-hydroxy acid dehydrogenase YdfG
MSARSQTVVITGASSGIGKATALHLDQLGFRVFAGVRKETDYQALKEEASDALTPLFLDVTDEDSIETAVRTVTEASAGKVDGLINNAGLSLNGPLELLPVADIRKLVDANIIGLLAVTRAFLPLLRES